MIELVLVRHGLTDSTNESKYCGWSDIPLNKEGLLQAEELKRKLSLYKFESIFSSPLKRTSETAKIINKNFKQKVDYHAALREYNFGIWENKTHLDIISNYQKEYNLWFNNYDYIIEGGESVVEFNYRVSIFLKEFLSTYQNGSFLFVSHAGCIRLIISNLLNLKIENSWNFIIKPAGITILNIYNQNRACLSQLNG